MARKNVLVIGLDPSRKDFAPPDWAAHLGLTPEKILAAVKTDRERLQGLGYDLQMCLTDLGETAETAVIECLTQKQFDCICIGAGIRTNEKLFLLFEKLINAVHTHAPQSKVCFNTLPFDTADAILRWV